jgi:hypothetical protein
MTITSSEAAVLRAIATNCFNAMNYDVPSCYEEANADIWTNCLNDAKYPSGIEGKALSGVCGSLTKKDMIVSYDSGRDSTMCMTESGYNAMVEFYGNSELVG